MSSTQVFTVIYVSPSDPRFKSLRRTLNDMYFSNLLGFNGCFISHWKVGQGDKLSLFETINA